MLWVGISFGQSPAPHLTRLPSADHGLWPQVADCVLWVGISFEQSASVEYFRRVRSMLASAGRLDKVSQARGR